MPTSSPRPVLAIILASFLLLAGHSFAAEFHVTPTGGTGTGAIGDPWSLTYAFSAPSAVQPGDTIWIHGGTYNIVGGLTSELVGTAANPIIVRQALGERAILDTGAAYDNRLFFNGSYTWYWGFEVTSSASDRWADVAPYTGIDRGLSIDVGNGASQVGIKIINVIVHDTAGAIGCWSGVTEAEVYGCLIYYNGFDASDRGHGHAIYSQNQTGTKKLIDNIMFGQYSHGIHCYTEGGFIDGFDIEGNISFDNGVISTISGATRDILVGGAKVANNPKVWDNYCYFAPAFGGTALDLGYGAGTANTDARDNYCVSSNGTAFRLDCAVATITGNTFYGTVDGCSSATYPSNTFYATRPTGVEVFVRPNLYESGRANICVFNWDNLDSVTADISGVVTVGHTYEVRDVQNYFGMPVVTGTYTGSPISIPMTSTAVAPVIGTPATPFVHTSKEFGAFVIFDTGDEVVPAINITKAVLSGTVYDADSCPPVITVGGADVSVSVAGSSGIWTSPEMSITSSPQTIPCIAADASGNTRQVNVAISH